MALIDIACQVARDPHAATQMLALGARPTSLDELVEVTDALLDHPVAGPLVVEGCDDPAVLARAVTRPHLALGAAARPGCPGEARLEALADGFALADLALDTTVASRAVRHALGQTPRRAAALLVEVLLRACAGMPSTSSVAACLAAVADADAPGDGSLLALFVEQLEATGVTLTANHLGATPYPLPRMALLEAALALDDRRLATVLLARRRWACDSSSSNTGPQRRPLDMAVLVRLRRRGIIDDLDAVLDDEDTVHVNGPLVLDVIEHADPVELDALVTHGLFDLAGSTGTPPVTVEHVLALLRHASERRTVETALLECTLDEAASTATVSEDPGFDDDTCRLLIHHGAPATLLELALCWPATGARLLDRLRDHDPDTARELADELVRHPAYDRSATVEHLARPIADLLGSGVAHHDLLERAASLRSRNRDDRLAADVADLFAQRWVLGLDDLTLAIRHGQAQAMLRLLTDRLPPHTVPTAVTLLEDGWTSSLDELVEVTTTLDHPTAVECPVASCRHGGPAPPPRERAT